MKTPEEMRLYKRNWARSRYGRTDESMKNSATYKGRGAELLALNFLRGSKDMNSEIMNRPYDLKWNGYKVDVKSCELYKRKIKRGKPVKLSSGWWVFNKNKNNADYYFCICLKNNKPLRYYLIPIKEFSKGITIGQKSLKFDKYILKSYE